MLKKFESYFDNTIGKQVFDIDCIVDGQRRPAGALKAPPVADADNQSTDGEDEEGVLRVANAAASADDGMVRDEWRLISCVEAYPTTGFFLPQCVDYGHEGGKVLKQAIPLINASHPDLTWNHSLDAKDVAGHIENARWEASKDIPWGVNATVVVDPEYDAKAAKGLASGHLRNGSIGLSMKCTKSHPDMDEEDFYTKQGEMVKGEKVRWLPEKIGAVRHMALVAAGTGADPNAGKRSQSTDNQAVVTKPKEYPMPEKLLALLQSVLGILKIDAIIDANAELPESVGERVEAKISKMADAEAKYNTLAADLQKIGLSIKDEKEADLTASETIERLPAVLALADQGKRLVEFKVKEALALFDKARFSPEKTELTDVEKRQRARIEKLTDLDHLEDLIVDYTELAEKKFPSRQSSQSTELPVEGAADKPVATGVEISARQSAIKLFDRNKEGE